MVAVALASATSFGHRGEVTLRPGSSATFDGHRLTFEGVTQVRTPASSATEALVVVDGHATLRPAVSQFGTGTDPVGTPAIDSSVTDDVYLTIDALPAVAHGPVTIGVTVQPLVSWLWAGGALIVMGATLAAVPGRRRRPTDPVSAPVPAVADASGDGGRHGERDGSGDAGEADDGASPRRRRPVVAAAGADRRDGYGERTDEASDEPVPVRSP